MKEDTIVAGAPRNNSKGSVVLMKVIMGDGDNKQLNPSVMLQGEQVGSYFGNSIAIIDVNNDG